MTTRIFQGTITAALLILLLLTGSGSADGWTIEGVDWSMSLRYPGNQNIQLHSAGYPCVTYCRYYAWFDGIDWHREVFDESSLGVGQSSLCLDSAGEPHIAYFDMVEDQLKYAYRDQSSWHNEAIANTGGQWPFCSLALDKSGIPHVGYQDAETGNLIYARRNEQGWQISTVDAMGDWSWGPSLRVDGAGHPHICYIAEGSSNDQMRYASYDGSDWQIEVLSLDVWQGSMTSLSLDKQGFPHIANGRSGNLNYGYKDSSGWHFEVADSSGYVVSWCSLALDSNGNVHIAYNDSEEQGYAFRDAAGWHVETIEGCVYYETGLASIAVDDPLGPHIVYMAINDWFGPYELKYAHKTAFGWNVMRVDGIGGIENSTIAMDEQGYPHMCYEFYYGEAYLAGDSSWVNGDVRYAHRDAIGWHIETVYTDLYIRGSSMALDGEGNPHLCSSVNRNLVYAYDDGSGWEITSLEHEGEATDISMTIGNNGYPHIVYCSYFGGGVCYMHQDEAEWHVETVYSGPRVTAGISMALDECGYPHIGYTSAASSASDPTLWYAYKDSIGWYVEELLGAEDMGWLTSLRVDSNNRPHLTYWGDGSLVHTTKQGTTWLAESVDNVQDDSWRYSRTSLDIDTDDHPHISYRNGDRIRYAFHDGEIWHVNVVYYSVGGCVSLALDAQGWAHISFPQGGCPGAYGYDQYYAFGEGVGTGEIHPGSVFPGSIQLLTIAPNPVTSSTAIRFSLGPGLAGTPRHASIKVYDLGGRLVAVPLEAEVSEGIHSALWNPGAEKQGQVPSGVYYVHIEADNPEASITEKLVVIK